MVARGMILSLVAVAGATTTAAAQQPKQQPKQAPVPVPARPAVPALIGATEVQKVSAATGFVDDVVAYDAQRLAYVIADASSKAELHVVTLGCAKCADNKQEIVVDLAPVTLRPTAVRLVGQRAFVVGTTEDGNQIAALVELSAKGTVVYKLGPATHITVVTRDGKPRVAVHRAVSTKTGTRHEVELDAIETGKRVAAGRALDLDTNDSDKKLELHVNHWAEGMTRAIGLKGGEWIKKENQRSPDTEATYDLISGKFVENKPIGDLFEQRKRYQALADAGGQLDFLRMAWDNSAVQLWKNGKPTALEIDQPIQSYDPKSLQGVFAADGTAWFVLKIDPVNPDAVARKKADPEYLDVFKATADGKAARKARILAAGMRHRFGVLGDKFWLLERSSGFDRGGRNLTVYSAP